MENYPSDCFLGLFSCDTLLYERFNFALGDFIAYLYPNTDRVMESDFSGVTACGFMHF
jgi:hypothetical protein